ncbi:MAG: hypothetical protein CVT88_04885 [Candidatus Altiarchaeales archaeon HGW-Altiarchaeales-1]|nr:MAG: hypothetical protein CVT88_04885 [Candidatus Altiarchaeales archaeon HGW-Altiarchaeales-1]
MATTLTDIIKKGGFKNREELAQYVKDNLDFYPSHYNFGPSVIDYPVGIAGNYAGEKYYKFSEVTTLMQATFTVDVKTGKKLADHLFRTGILKEYQELNLLNIFTLGLKNGR